jgi:hypothetical protein
LYFQCRAEANQTNKSVKQKQKTIAFIGGLLDLVEIWLKIQLFATGLMYLTLFSLQRAVTVSWPVKAIEASCVTPSKEFNFNTGITQANKTEESKVRMA